MKQEQCLSKKREKEHTLREKEWLIAYYTELTLTKSYFMELTIPQDYFVTYEKLFGGRIVDKAVDHGAVINVLESNDDKSGSSTETELSDDVITGEDAVRFYELITSPPKDTLRERIIEEALQRFPNPEEPTDVDIDL